MRKGLLASILVGLLLAALCGQCAAAQSPAPEQNGGPSKAAPCPCANTSNPMTPMLPYTAIRKTTRVQKLANGVTITTTTSLKEARDSCGRTYHENRPDLGGVGTTVTDFTNFTVYDPVAKVNINWNGNSRTAMVYHMQPRNMATASVTMRTGTKQFFPAREVEQLGVKSFDGHDATGNRTTTIYAAGSVGNDLPFSVTEERWILTDLRVDVLQIDDDPRTGIRTSELTEINRGEPDPALFRAPEGYTVKEQNPNPQN